jgi:hypothetical protein
MLKLRTNYTAEREKALAEGIRDVAAELRLVEVTDFIAFIQTGQFANIGSLVNSSAEMYFKPDTLGFGFSGDVDLKWGGTPSVFLDMEFRHCGVNVYFRLLLAAAHGGVEINYISFDEAAADPDGNTGRLVDAIADARLMPLPAMIPPSATASRLAALYT